MDAILEYLKMNPPVAAAIIAFIGVIVSAFVAFTVAKKSTYITAVTVERSKWIDKLRGNIADLLGVCGSMHLSLPDIKSEKALAKRQDADRLIALITMQLNPNDKSGIDKNLIALLPQLVVSAEKSDNSYRLIEQRFVRHAQFLLKEEWEKVKSEAKGTILSWLTGASCKRRRRAREYREFCKVEG